MRSAQLVLGDPAAGEPESSSAGELLLAGGRPATVEQVEAVRAADPYVFVEASAGSGKTGVLVARYCDAVERSERGADAVLAFTFTEKAAAELRARIGAELRRRAGEAGGLGEADRERRATEAARAPGAWVTTIHGFCRRLLASHPITAGVDPRFRVLDAAESDLLADRAFAGALEAHLADDRPARLALAAATGAGLAEMIRGAYGELRSMGQERPALPENPAPELAGALEALGEAARGALEETGDARGETARDARGLIAEAAALTESGGGEAPTLDELARLRFSSKAKALRGPAVARYHDALRRMLERSAADRYESIRELLRTFGVAYQERKAARLGLDFEDLQLRAVRLLRDRPRIAEALAERFSDILVDEFQDTNLLQVELIKRLRGPDTRLFTVGDEFQSIYGFRHADVEVFRAERERGRRLALRGNFRSAPGVLAAVNAIGRALLNGFEPLTVGALPPTPAEGAATIGPAVEVIAVQADGWDEEEVGLTGDEQVDAAPQRIAEARVLAHRLAELASSGVPRGEMVVLLRAFGDVSAYEEALERAGLRPAVAGGRGYWSQQQVEDMRCLLGVLANPLDDQRLLGALASPACGASPDALWILRRLAGRRRHIWPELSRRFGPGDDRAAPVPGGESDRSEGEDAAGPLGASGAESDREVDAHAEADEPLEEAERLIAAIPPEEAERLIAATPAEDADRLRGFCARVAALRPDAGLLPLDSLVERAARDFGYDLAVLMAPRGRRRWANVRKLMTLAREHEEREGRDLAGFLEVLEARAERDEREPEAAVETEGHDGVRIMTVHNAKGLEFGTVAVADLGRRLGAGGFAPALRLRREGGADGPMRIGLRLARAARDSLRLFDLDALHREARDDEAAEELRLIHVAVSRAQRRLILAGTLDPAALARAADGAPKPSDPPLLRILRALGLGARDGVPALESADGELSPIGAGANVRVPAPEAREGLEASFAGGEIAISFHRPGPSAGAELATVRHEAEERPRGPSGEPPGPPVAARERLPPPPSAGHLSHAALDLYARCGYRFYVERVAGLRAAPPPQADPEAEREEGEPDEPGSSERMALGTAVHGLLEWSARHRWLRPGEPTVLAHLRRGGLEGTGPERRRAQGLLDAWLESALCSELRTGRARTLPEAPFLLPVAGTLVRGKLDLLVERPGEPPLLVDYKTNALGGTSPAKLMALYAAQRDLYALAVASAAASGSASRVESGGGGDGDGPTLAPVSTAFVFLEQGGEPALATLGPEALATVRSRIEGLATGIAAARFEVTERPHRGLCHDCPARERLCSHPDELTMKPCHPLP